MSIPSLDISDGLESSTTGPPNGVESNLELPSFPSLGSSPQVRSPALPNPDSTLAANERAASSNRSPFPGERVPVESTKENNFQKIQYPQAAASSFSTVMPKPQPEIARHELVDPSRDQGLIDVLKRQQEANAMTDNHQFVAQPIASSDSTFNGLATKLEAVDTDTNGFEIGIEDQTKDNPSFDIQDFNTAFGQAEQFIEAAEFRAALELLSGFYRNNELSGPQRQRLLPTLDALAGKVIYSDEHHLAGQPYVVGTNESLVDIAAKWKVPAQLIYNVHQKTLKNPLTDIQPGTELKRIPGPFQAEVDLQTKVLTLFLGDLYAGRFPIRVGISGAPQPGKYSVVLKSESGHTWRDSKGMDYPPGSPQNGYGPNWIGLTGSLCIHEVSDEVTDGHHGCIGLSANDARDVFAILAEESEMTIVR